MVAYVQKPYLEKLLENGELKYRIIKKSRSNR